MGTLLRELAACCHDRSTSTHPFSYEVENPHAVSIRNGTGEADRCVGGVDVTPAYAGAPTIVKMASQLAKRVPIAPHKRKEKGIAVSAQMSVNYAPMEIQGQPWAGWDVDLTSRWYRCNYCHAFGICVHVLYALRVTENVDSRGRIVLVNRKERKRTGGDIGGRPLAVGPALTY
ncbi:hypothetical protein F443_00298 [Phytophthora nicotianae P1569]|uniref:Uncharacterized protein n=2 Tax=Phytophthora nicotianae TaxID=4792 RepID=V9G238_PHYNI|nr:hypothetical protein F443_00298 [Phytophthora nicotianae P1569]